MIIDDVDDRGSSPRERRAAPRRPRRSQHAIRPSSQPAHATAACSRQCSLMGPGWGTARGGAEAAGRRPSESQPARCASLTIPFDGCAHDCKVDSCMCSDRCHAHATRTLRISVSMGHEAKSAYAARAHCSKVG
eukprot:SAG31_NODE_362_length_16904_cov_7.893218_10_plen_134_part_00